MGERRKDRQKQEREIKGVREKTVEEMEMVGKRNGEKEREREREI